MPSVPAKPNTPIFETYSTGYPSVIRTFSYPDNGGSAITSLTSYFYNSADELISDFTQNFMDDDGHVGISYVDDVRDYSQFGSLYINYTVTNAIGTSEISDNSLPFVAIPPVENDYRANATLLSGTSISGDNTYSGTEDDETEPAGVEPFGSHSVWFKWVPNANFFGSAPISAQSYDFTTSLSIWQGNIEVDYIWNDQPDIGVNFTPIPFEIYYIRLASTSDMFFGDYTLNYPNPAPSGYKRGYGISRY